MKYTINFYADVDINVEADSDEEARNKAEEMLRKEHHNENFAYVYIRDVNFIEGEKGDVSLNGKF